MPPLPFARAASGRFKSAVLKAPHLNAVHLNNSSPNKPLSGDEDKAFQAVKGIEKHRNHNEKKKGKHYEYEYHNQQHHNALSGRQIQRGSSERHRQQPSVSKSRPAEPRTIRGYDFRMTDDTTSETATNRSSSDRGETKKGRKKVCCYDENQQGT